MTARYVLALCLGTLPLSAPAALAQDMVSYTTDQSFDDVVFGLENAIIDAGLVIYSFCSAQLSREVMEADWRNVMFCPYDIFVAVRHETPDETVIGFRAFPEGEMQKIQELLDGIARTAIGLD